MPSAGAVAAPVAMPLRAPIPGKSSQFIDSATYLEFSTITPNCKIYFTTDGTKPNPFDRKSGKESTHRYKAPFCLKPGKRLLKMVAVSRDGLRESDITTKKFIVENATDDDNMSLSTISFAEEKYGRDRKSRRGRTSSRNQVYFDEDAYSVDHTSVATEDDDFDYEAYGVASHQYDPWRAPLHGRGWVSPSTPGREQMPEPFQYPGDLPIVPTQPDYIQAPSPWNARPASAMPGMQGNGVPSFSTASRYNPMQINRLGYLTNEMLHSLDDGRHVTVAELKQVLATAQKPQKPPPREKSPPLPQLRDPPLLPVSPGNGNWSGNIDHVYAHLKQHAKEKSGFRAQVGEPRMGTILGVEFEESDCGYMLRIEFDRIDKPKIKPKPKPVVKPIKPKIQPPPEPPKKKPEVPKPDPPKPKPKAKPEPKKDEDPYFQTEDDDSQPTVYPWPDFSPEKDAERLKKAMKGIGTDEKVLISVMAKRSATQRVALAKQYKTMFGEDLAEALGSETSGNFAQALKALCMAPAVYDASECHRAIDGLGTDEDAIIEILCTRTNKQIEMLKRTYKEKYNVELEKDIVGDTSGNFQKLLVSLLQGNRPETKEYDLTAAKADATALHAAGEGKWGTEESKFNEILVNRSYPHLRAVFTEYDKLSKKGLEEAIKAEFSGDICRALLTVVRTIRNKQASFAKCLYRSLKGLGTDDNNLIRILITRCEIDMVQIIDEYQKAYKETLEEAVGGDTSGDYKKLLCTLIRGNRGDFEEVELDRDEEGNFKEKDTESYFQTEEDNSVPTLYPAKPFNPEQDTEKLFKAMDKWGTDEDVLIDILAARSISQRAEISKLYKTKQGKDLAKHIDSETSGNFCKLLMKLCQGAPEVDARELHDAIAGLGTDEDALIEILCTRTNAQIAAIKTEYKTLFGDELEKDVIGDTSGNIQKFLVSSLQGNRPETKEYDVTEVKADAAALHEAGEKKWGTDESRFNVVMSSRSYAHLRAMFEEYKTIAGKELEESIKSEFSGDIQKAMLTVISVIRNKHKYFAEKMRKAVRGMGTDDTALVRIVITRCEIDMKNIKQEYSKEFNRSLVEDVKADTSGDYRKTLMKLLGEK